MTEERTELDKRTPGVEDQPGGDAERLWPSEEAPIADDGGEMAEDSTDPRLQDPVLEDGGEEVDRPA